MFAKKKKSSDAEEQLQQDKHLIVAIQPQGGITFSDEKLIKTGDGYEIILHIYRYPKYIDKFWLTQIVNIDNVVVTIDIETKDQQKNPYYVRKRYAGEDRSRRRVFRS